MSFKHTRIAVVGGLAAAIAVAPIAAVASTQGSPAATPAAAVATAGAVYQGRLTGANLLLGPQSNPTTIVQTPPLPAGTYLVNYTVGVVMGDNTNVVCAASSVASGQTNDGLFGTVGNGATRGIPAGPNGLYGNAVMTDVFKVPANDRIRVICNNGNGASSTIVGAASVTALKVARAVIN